MDVTLEDKRLAEAVAGETCSDIFSHNLASPNRVTWIPTGPVLSTGEATAPGADGEAIAGVDNAASGSRRDNFSVNTVGSHTRTSLGASRGSCMSG